MQDCYWLLSVICTLATGSIVYGCGTALIRCIYVQSSTKSNIQAVLKRDSFVFKSILIGECLNYSTLLLFFFFKQEMVLNEACKDPYVTKGISLPHVMPVTQTLIFLYTHLSIACNIFLTKYLLTQDMMNIAKNEVDKKKDRKRNLVPSHIGVFMLISYFVSYGVCKVE